MDKIALIALKKSGAPDISAAIAAKEAAQAAQEAAETAQGKAEDAAEELEDALEDIEELQSDVSTLQEDTSDLKSHVSATEIVVQTDSQPIVQLSDGSANNAKSYDIQIVPQQAGSGDPSPENVRPISGWTGAKVKRRGFNQWDEEWEVGGFSIQSGAPWETSDRIRSKNYIPILPSNTYFAHYPSTYFNLTGFFYDADKNYISSVYFNKATFITPANAYYMRFASSDHTTYDNDICINFSDPSRNGEYEPYSGADYSISFPQSAGTVYGGSLHVDEDGSGTLVVDEVAEKFDTVVDGYLTSSLGLDFIGGTNAVSEVGDVLRVSFSLTENTSIRSAYNLISSSYEDKMSSMLTHYFSYNSDTPHWYRDTILYGYFPKALVGSTTESVLSYLTSIKDTTPLTFMLPLATPQTYTLTAPQIALLLGTNNIWADAGNMAVEYIADTKLYIQTLTGHPDEDMIADANIASGKFFMVGNTLYLATANIANGSTVVPGTNCTKMSLAAALNSINA